MNAETLEHLTVDVGCNTHDMLPNGDGWIIDGNGDGDGYGDAGAQWRVADGGGWGDGWGDGYGNGGGTGRGDGDTELDI
jgi:hypothetical protein